LRTAGRNVEVINAGVGNYNTSMEVAYFLGEGFRYGPHVVVLNYSLNDAEPRPTYRPPSLWHRHSYAFVWLGGRLDVLARLLGHRQGWDDYYRGLYEAPGWTDAERGIARLAAHCRQHGMGLLVANYPELRRLNPYPFAAARGLVAAAAERSGAGYLDLYPAVRDERPESLWVTAPDTHPNGRAHALYAEALAPMVTRMLDRFARGAADER
jgi:hypothetical protein